MTAYPQPSKSPFLYTYYQIPEDAKVSSRILTKAISDIAFRINQREISLYEKTIQYNGQKWFWVNNNEKRSGYRVVVQGTMAGVGIVLPHGIPDLANGMVTRLSGVMQGAGPFIAYSIDHADPAAPIVVSVDAVNVNVGDPTGSYVGQKALVVLEFVRNQ